MTSNETAASTMPTVECSARSPCSNDSADSTDTYAASAKNDTAITLSAARSRCSGSRPANCQATAVADATSITESSPNPISAVEPATVPAASAMTASTTL